MYLRTINQSIRRSVSHSRICLSQTVSRWSSQASKQSSSLFIRSFHNSTPIASDQQPTTSSINPPNARSNSKLSFNGKSPFIVLGIETTCDDTSLAIVKSSYDSCDHITSDRSDGLILSQCHLSQWQLHSAYGGVHPKEASMMHEKNIEALYQSLFDQTTNESSKQSNNQSKLNESMIDAISVASGPGLGLCLGVGLEWAKQLSARLGVPIIGVNHLLAHIAVTELSQINHSIAINSQSTNQAITQSTNQQTDQSNANTFGYPYLSLLISGGHSELWFAADNDDITIIGRTMDSACGEAFDKVARSIGITAREEAPGRTIEKMAAITDMERIRSTNQSIKQLKSLPVPLKNDKNCDFSFTGLKSAVERSVAQLKSFNQSINQSSDQLTEEQRHYLAAEFQASICAHIDNRVRRALAWCRQHHPECNRFIVAGGVASSSAIRATLQSACDDFGFHLMRPTPQLCTDNGVMIAWQGIQQLARGQTSDHETLRFVTKWPVGPFKQIVEKKIKKGREIERSFELVDRQ